jgi:hypothetical protein
MRQPNAQLLPLQEQYPRITINRFLSRKSVRVRLNYTLKADIAECGWNVRFVPKADISSDRTVFPVKHFSE